MGSLLCSQFQFPVGCNVSKYWLGSRLVGNVRFALHLKTVIYCAVVRPADDGPSGKQSSSKQHRLLDAIADQESMNGSASSEDA